MTEQDVQSNYKELLEQLGLLHNTAKLMAVSKTAPSVSIEAVYQMGQRDFGENTVQELLEKSLKLAHLPNLVFHFIGHLQSNKIPMLMQVKQLRSIHSIDSLGLLKKLYTFKVSEGNPKIGIFLQCNISKEPQKYGFLTTEEVFQAYEFIASHPHPVFSFQGLMGIGPHTEIDFLEKTKEAFSALVELKESLISKYNIEKLELSMGMGSDYQVAIELKSDILRIGSLIFGSR